MPISKLPGTLRVPAVSALAACRGSPAASRPAARPGARAASAAGDGRQAGQAAGRRPRRVRRPLRRGRRHRGARARVGLPRCHPLQGRAAGEEGRPSVHHRPAALRGLAGAGPGEPGAGPRQPRLRRGRPGARAGPGARQHHHAADLRPAHAGQARGRGLGGGAGGGRAPGHARSRVHRAARAGIGTHRRPARVAGQPGHGRHDRHHDAARHHHVDRSDPLRVHHG